jgi:hypothetical protein
MHRFYLGVRLRGLVVGFGVGVGCRLSNMLDRDVYVVPLGFEGAVFVSHQMVLALPLTSIAMSRESYLVYDDVLRLDSAPSPSAPTTAKNPATAKVIVQIRRSSRSI